MSTHQEHAEEYKGTKEQRGANSRTTCSNPFDTFSVIIATQHDLVPVLPGRRSVTKQER